LIRKQHIRSGTAAFLALLMLLTWGLKVGHALFSHHDHEGHICELSGTNSSQQHFHDTSYLLDEDCSLCEFTISVVPVANLDWWLPDLPAIISHKPTLKPLSDFVCFTGSATCLRGPPVVA
jgi:hypothetical protein